MTSPAATVVVATEPVIRARLTKASAKNYRRGVLGLRAKPAWDGGDFDHDGTPVRVATCPSVLAIWEAIDSRDPGAWTVILTSVEDDELGDTVLAHLIDGRLITPDPWDALRSNFSATTIEPALYRASNDRAVANGLLSVLAPKDYSPAPGGVLTRDHAMSAIARTALNMVAPDVDVDALAILEWSRQHDAGERLTELRGRGGPDLTGAVTRWLAGRAGGLAKPLTALLDADRVADLVPLGIVAGLFCDDDSSHAKALGVFLGRYRLNTLLSEDLHSWYTGARGLVTSMLDHEQQQSALSAAAAVVDELGITAVAESSDLLRHGLNSRLDALARAITAAVPAQLHRDIDAALITVEGLRRIERAWVQVRQHLLAPATATTKAFAGAVRLIRWLAVPCGAATGLAGAATSYARSDSWVDLALIKTRRGADTPYTGAALRTVIDTAAARRARQDRRFADALADAPTPTVPTIENVLRDLVIPIAHKEPALLIVIDALSSAAANDLVAAVQKDGWIEVSASFTADRAFALAVLPTLTQRSRCSLLCGELREGADNVERAGFLSLIHDARLESTGGVPDPIFHKKALDAIPAGLQLATDVNNAVADVERQPLVALVLNYVDDTLHHTDPGGTDWNLGTITHLRALLDAAKNAGRTVVITSDHGHIIEYGTSAKVDRTNAYGQRAHGDFENVDPDREVVVEGPRVLTHDHRVVLAVDEDIRYGVRNAGYHGGATPAEAIVPVIALVTGRLPDWAVPVSGAEPSWWNAATLEPAPVAVGARTQQAPAEPGLFDELPTEVLNPLPDKVIRTKVFRSQFQLAGRIVVKDSQIKDLLHTLLRTGAHEITLAQAAIALGVATASVNGALLQTKRVLDVEGYEVLRVGAGVVGLDVAALREQFGVSE